MTRKDEIALNVRKILLDENRYLTLNEIYEKYISMFEIPGEKYDSYIRGSIYKHCLDRDLLINENEIYFYSLSPKGSNGNQYGLIEWNNDNIDDLDDVLSRLKSEPKYKKNIRPVKRIISEKEIIIRRKAAKVFALVKANYNCEIDCNHPSFIRKSNNKNYTEPHHLIPIAFQDDFGNNSLDIPENIVSLCSNCHNEIHYGVNGKNILKRLYDERKDELEKNNIGITFEQLCKYYNL